MTPRGRRDDRPIGILYEHPEWFKLLFAELERRGLPFEPLYVDEHRFDPAEREVPYSLVVNRVSPSSYLRGHAGSILYARQYLAYLRDLGVPVVNGYDAYTLETSKALQLLLFERLGVRYPRARVVNHPSQVVAAAEGLRYPVIVKPNIGGSGALMQRFDSPAALAEAAQAGVLDLGVDHTALVQEYVAPAGGSIVRVEVLDGEYLYAIRIETNPDEGFNLCPADLCRVDGAPENGSRSRVVPNALPPAPPPMGDGGAATGPALAVAPAATDGATMLGAACDYGAGAVAAAAGSQPSQAGRRERAPAATARRALRVEAYTPPREIVETAIRLVRAGGLDVGGVEYLIAERDGEAYFYDVNALSNFVADAPRVVGFDPTARFVDYLARRAGLREAVPA